MKQIVCEKPYHFKMTDVKIPELKDGEALVRIKRIGICGTDFHAYCGKQPFSLIQGCSDTSCPVKLSASMIPAERLSLAIKCQLFLIWNAEHASPAGTAGPTAA